MTETSRSPVFVNNRPQPAGNNLADVLERVLDKGIVIVGDIQVNLLDIELLTIKIRLMVASVERAKEMGINWWEGDPFITKVESGDEKSDEELDLRRRLEELERKVSEQPELLTRENERDRR